VLALRDDRLDLCYGRGPVRSSPLLAFAPRLPGPRATLVAVLALGALLLLPSLGSVRLWQDEAETALLGRNTLRFGVPTVWDGRNLVAQYYSLDFDHRLLFQKGWLPPYAVAASFAVAGETTLAARLPFALLGLASLWLCHRLALRLTRDRATAALASVLLALSLPFLLYARQCRWYALAMALTLLLFEAEDRLDERGGWLRAGLVVTALFHTNALVCAATVGGLLLARVVSRGRRATSRPLALALGVAALGCVPFLVVFPPFSFAAESVQLGDYGRRLLWMLGDFNRWILPLPGLALLLLLGRGEALRAPWFRRVLLASAVTLVLAAVPMWNGLVAVVGFRYAVHLLPVAAICLAHAVRTLPFPPWLGAAVVALHLSTHALGFPLSYAAGPRPDPLLRTDLVDYVHTLRRPVRGPIDAAVEFLAPRVRANDAVFTPYEQLPLQFYLPVRTVGLQGAAGTLERLHVLLPAYVGDILPGDLDWYVPRAAWNGFLGAPTTEALLPAAVARGFSPVRHELAGPDTTWQTREYTPEHPFRDPVEAPRLVVYEIQSPPTRPLP
jgi:hypothetical protein